MTTFGTGVGANYLSVAKNAKRVERVVSSSTGSIY
jgi:hypothetical protein